MKTPRLIELQRERLDIVDEARELLSEMEGNPAKADEIGRRHDAAMRKLDQNKLDIEAERLTSENEESRAANRPHGPDTEAYCTDEHGQLQPGRQSPWIDQRGNPVRVLARRDRMAERQNEGVGLGDLIRAKITGPRNEAETRALSEGTNSAGGFTVPTPLAAAFIDRLRSRSVAMQAGAMTVPMESATLAMARLETDPDCAWRAENAPILEGDPTFGRVLFAAKTLAGKLTLSRELAEDSINVGAIIETAFAGAMAVELDRAAIYGDGTGANPRGVWHTSGINAVSMGTNGAALADYDGLLDAALALKNANAGDPTAMICAPRTEIALAKLKNADSEPLRAPELIGRIPLLSTTSAPVDEAEGTADDASSIVLGDFTQLMIGLRSSLEIRVFDQPLAGSGQLLVVAWMRADAQLATPKSFCKLTGIIPAS